MMNGYCFLKQAMLMALDTGHIGRSFSFRNTLNLIRGKHQWKGRKDADTV